MRKELVKFILAKRADNNSEMERRNNIYDRRSSRTYVEKERRSGINDRRANISELMKKFMFRNNVERRCGKRDRRELNTFIKDDRRSGISDRRFGSRKRK